MGSIGFEGFIIIPSLIFGAFCSTIGVEETGPLSSETCFDFERSAWFLLVSALDALELVVSPDALNSVSSCFFRIVVMKLLTCILYDSGTVASSYLMLTEIISLRPCIAEALIIIPLS